MIIEIKNYSKAIRGTTVLDSIDLELKSGRVYGLKGPNGCGKTMLMRAICGLILPTQGQITIDGETLGKEIDFPRSIGALLENPSFISNYSGFKNLEVIASIKDEVPKEKITEILKFVGLNPSDKKHYKKYSLGMKQKLGIAGAVMEEPDILILDEPLNALDTDGINMVHGVVNSFKERNSVVIIACHDSEDMMTLADEIITIENGKVIKQEIAEGQNDD